MSTETTDPEAYVPSPEWYHFKCSWDGVPAKLYTGSFLSYEGERLELALDAMERDLREDPDYWNTDSAEARQDRSYLALGRSVQFARCDFAIWSEDVVDGEPITMEQMKALVSGCTDPKQMKWMAQRLQGVAAAWEAMAESLETAKLVVRARAYLAALESGKVGLAYQHAVVNLETGIGRGWYSNLRGSMGMVTDYLCAEIVKAREGRDAFDSYMGGSPGLAVGAEAEVGRDFTEQIERLESLLPEAVEGHGIRVGMVVRPVGAPREQDVLSVSACGQIIGVRWSASCGPSDEDWDRVRYVHASDVDAS
jgi:hypothetical protein